MIAKDTDMENRNEIPVWRTPLVKEAVIRQAELCKPYFLEAK